MRGAMSRSVLALSGAVYAIRSRMQFSFEAISDHHTKFHSNFGALVKLRNVVCATHSRFTLHSDFFFFGEIEPSSDAANLF